MGVPVRLPPSLLVGHRKATLISINFSPGAGAPSPLDFG
jgi:hypothetical protein